MNSLLLSTWGAVAPILEHLLRQHPDRVRLAARLMMAPSAAFHVYVLALLKVSNCESGEGIVEAILSKPPKEVCIFLEPDAVGLFGLLSRIRHGEALEPALYDMLAGIAMNDEGMRGVLADAVLFQPSLQLMAQIVNNKLPRFVMRHCLLIENLKEANALATAVLMMEKAGVATDAFQARSRRQLRRFVARHLQEARAPWALAIPERLPLVQLMTGRDLRYAGRRYANCLGNGSNYLERLLSGAAIFLVWRPGEEDAVILQLDRSGGVLTLRQARHRGNRRVLEQALVRVLEALASIGLELAPSSVGAAVTVWANESGPLLHDPWEDFP